MSKRLFPVLVSLTLIGGCLFFWWNTRPEQQLTRQTELLLDQIRFQKLSLRTATDRHEQLEKVLAEELRLEGSHPVPSESLSREEFYQHLDELHSYVTLLEVDHGEILITRNAETAELHLDLTVKGAAGQKYQVSEAWSLRLLYEKQDRWRLTYLKAVRQP